MITLAKDGMRPQLERLWKQSFPQDTPQVVRYFFERRYNPNACIVYIDPEAGGVPTAMLHLLDAMITDDCEVVPVQYLYAAATDKSYRGQGIMTNLLRAADEYARQRGNVYSIVVPGSSALFRFYEKRGFHRCYANRVMTLSRRDMQTLSEDGDSKIRTRRVMLGDNELAQFRRDALTDHEGYVTWDKRAVAYAMGAHEAEGGQIVAVVSGFEAAFAFCKEMDGGLVAVNEFIASNDLSPALCAAILEQCQGDTFSLRLPASNDFFAPYGDIADFGMIKAIDGRRPTSLLTLTGRHIPYLGLALD